MAERRWLVHMKVGVPLLVEANAEIKTIDLLDAKSELARRIHAPRAARSAPPGPGSAPRCAARWLRTACTGTQEMRRPNPFRVAPALTAG